MKKRFIQLFFAVAIAAVSLASPVFATDFTQDELIDQGLNAYEINGCSTTVLVTGGNSNVNTTAAQTNNIKTIIGVAKTENLTQKAALIALMTAQQESHMNDYANDGSQAGGQDLKNFSSSNPNSAGFPPEGSDHDSVGIFQQRPLAGWSTFANSGITQNSVWQIMGSTKSDQAVAYSAEAFFGTPKGAKLPSGLANPSALQKGLQNKVPNYTDASVSPGAAAQTVQGSAYPHAYDQWQTLAQSLVDKYWNDSPPVELPVPIDGSGASTPASGTASCNNGAGGTNVSTGQTATINKMLSKILEYAWPNYCKKGSGSCDGYASPVTKKPEYQKAVSAGGYNGDSCFGGGVDCGAFVTHVMRDSGADPHYNSANGPTTSQKDYLDAHSTGPDAIYVRIPASAPLQAGDIAVNDHHTWIYVGNSLQQYNFHGDAASASQCDRAPMAGPSDTRSDYSWYRIIK